MEEDVRSRLFEELSLPALDDLYRFACRLERNPARAADLLQDSLITGLRKFSQLSRSESFRSWMVAIIRRTFLNRRRRAEPSVGFDPEDPDRPVPLPAAAGEAGPDHRLLARQLAGELKAALDELPEEQRLAVFLIDVQGFTYAEAAEGLATTPGTVASRVARGRARLRDRLRHLARERGWAR